MTPHEVELGFWRDLDAVIASARAAGMNGGDIAHRLRSVAYEVSRAWAAELDRRNAERIAAMKSV